MEHKITFIVPVYDVAEEYLRPCLRSVVEQTLREIEIIIVDNGSIDDRIIGILAEFAERDPRIRILTLAENRRYSGGVAAGIAEVRTEYFQIVDGDDVVHPRLAEIVLQAAEAGGADIVLFDYHHKEPEFGIDAIRFFDQWRQEPGEMARADIEVGEYRSLLAPSFHLPYLCIAFPLMWNKLFRTEMIRGNAVSFLFTQTCCEDNYFCWVAVPHAEKIVRISDTLYWYVNRLSSVMETRILESVEGAFAVMHGISRRLAEKGLFERWSPMFRLNELEIYYGTFRRLEDRDPGLLKHWRRLLIRYATPEFAAYLQSPPRDVAVAKSLEIELLRDTLWLSTCWRRYSWTGIKKRLKQKLLSLARRNKATLFRIVGIFTRDIRSGVASLERKLIEWERCLAELAGKIETLENNLDGRLRRIEQALDISGHLKERHNPDAANKEES